MALPVSAAHGGESCRSSDLICDNCRAQEAFGVSYGFVMRLPDSRLRRCRLIILGATSSVRSSTICRFLSGLTSAAIPACTSPVTFPGIETCARFNEGLLDILFARSRAQVHQFLATVAPCIFHRLIFSVRAPQTPPWEKNDLFNWRPSLTPLYRVAAPKRGRSQLRLRSQPLNMLVELRTAGWEYEVLKQSDG